MQLRGLISINDVNELAERIAKLIDESLNTHVDDMTHINNLIEKEIEIAYLAEQRESVGAEINGGSR
jgi:hypothetical protein